MQHPEPSQHITVLKKEAVEALTLERDSVVIDATLGAGGHTREILTKLGKNALLISLDADQVALDEYGDTTKNHFLVCKNFRDIPKVLEDHQIDSVDAILADLGWRQEQFINGGKGFSFMSDDPLIMTFGAKDEYHFTAEEIVNEWDEAVIADIIYGYGEERAARKIARAIIERPSLSLIKTARELADLVALTVPTKASNRIHPATKTFQALRIAVNDELETLKAFIRVSIDALNQNGRLAIITFHSLEDRIVKHEFRSLERDQSIGVVITKKPITPTALEIKDNPRARSAKLRIFEKN